jgi:glutamine phosphoribosylpyrophosphate amidotransferase
LCGICGIHRFGDAPIDPIMVDLLILHNQNRGLEAAGIALQQAGLEARAQSRDRQRYYSGNTG